MRCGFNAEPLEITENGEYNVKDRSTVNVNVEGGGSYEPVGDMTEVDTLTWNEFKALVDQSGWESTVAGKTYYVETP